MTAWAATVGDLLERPAEALVCSANPQLRLSGGVGGAFRLKYGDAMQEHLHEWLAKSGQPFVLPGQIVVAPACGSPFHRVIHAVVVDVFYDTSAEVIARAYAAAFAAAANERCRTVVAACLGCGYGRASPQTLVEGVAPYLLKPLAGIDRVEFVSRDAEPIEALRSALRSAAQREVAPP